MLRSDKGTARDATGDAQPREVPRDVNVRLTPAQRAWLKRGLSQPGGKLPLFDRDGKRVNAALVQLCIEAGWAEPWFANPMKPDWLVCKLTAAGRYALDDA